MYFRVLSSWFEGLDVDWLDKAIMMELYSNARVSVQDLAKQFDVSFNTIKTRIKKLEQTGAIQEYAVELSLEMLDAENLFIDITTDGKENMIKLIEQIGNHLLVRFVYRTGNRKYHARAVVAGTVEFFDLKQFIESLDSVNMVEIHPYMWIAPYVSPQSKARTRGHRVTFSKNQLRVLQCLVDDVRIPVREISKRTRPSPRRVTRILAELQKDGGVHFTMRMVLFGDVELKLFVRYDETKTTFNHIIEWFQEHYFFEFWGAALWLDEPVLEVLLYPIDKVKISEITREVRKLPIVDLVEDYLLTKDSFVKGQYPGPSHIRLVEMIKEAGL